METNSNNDEIKNPFHRVPCQIPSSTNALVRNNGNHTTNYKPNDFEQIRGTRKPQFYSRENLPTTSSSNVSPFRDYPPIAKPQTTSHNNVEPKYYSNYGKHQSDLFRSRQQANKSWQNKTYGKYKKTWNKLHSNNIVSNTIVPSNSIPPNSIISNTTRSTLEHQPLSLPLIDVKDSDKTRENSNQSVVHNVSIQNISNELDLAYESDTSGDSGDLDKLNMMTAIDFNLDRYARYSVHESEIKDYVRTITYKNCIEQCAERYIEGKVVLVVRCGIGLLAMMCVRLGGAKRVIAVEKSACIEYARRIVKDNGCSRKITLIQTSIHDLKKLPHDLSQVDVIVSDFMGECVLSQGDEMEEVIEARDRFLKPNGLMIPMCVTLYTQLLEQRRVYEQQRFCKVKKKKNKSCDENSRQIKFDQSLMDGYDTDSSSDSTICSWWGDVYGFNMKSKSEFLVDANSDSEEGSNLDGDGWRVMTEPIIAFFDPCKVVSSPCLVKKFDMYKCTIAEARHVQSNNMKLVCSTPYTSPNGGDYAHMLELFMVVDFPDEHGLFTNKDDVQIGFSTSCFSPHTRYRQTGLLLRDQLIVNQGDEFIINDFSMWRGHQENKMWKNYDSKNKSKDKLFQKISTIRIKDKPSHDENLKLRLKYTFVNKHMKAINRRCAYTLKKELF